MDTGEAGAAQQQQQREPGEKVVRQRGKSSSKQVRCRLTGPAYAHSVASRPCCCCCWASASAFVHSAMQPRDQHACPCNWHACRFAHPAHVVVPAPPQKQRKRKSLEKALAVASRTETKVAKTSARKDGKKGLKKLWTNDGKADK